MIKGDHGRGTYFTINQKNVNLSPFFIFYPKNWINFDLGGKNFCALRPQFLTLGKIYLSSEEGGGRIYNFHVKYIPLFIIH